MLPLRRLRVPPGPAATAAQAAIRALATALPWDEGRTMLCRSLGRHKLFVSATDTTHAPHLALDGFWKWWLTTFLARNLAPGETFVDGGACYGYFTLLAADLVGPEGRVIAVEPNPDLCRLLRRNLALNGFAERATAVPAALGPREVPASPQARFAAPAGNPMGGTLLAPHEVPPATGAEGGAMTMHPAPRMATLDRLAPQADVVKLDLNGGELAAWRGMRDLVGRRPGLRVLLGLDPLALAEDGVLAPWLAEVAAAGLAAYRIGHDSIARPVAADGLAAEAGGVTLWLSRSPPL